MLRSLNVISLLFSCGSVFLSCNDSTSVNDPIPFVPFDNIEININSIAYNDLKTVGYVIIPGGVKGIIIYKNPFEEEYIAYERNCTYMPLNNDAIVEIDGSTLFMVDKSCGSQFNLNNGWPNSGAASIPLRRYRTIVSGSILIITDEPL